MVERSQNGRMGQGERKTLRFTGTNQDTGQPINYAADYASVRYSLSPISPTGQINPSPSVEKNSTVAQPETGGNEIDFAGSGNSQALAQLIRTDTENLNLGDYFQQLSGFDAQGEEVILSEGVITLEINLENT